MEHQEEKGERLRGDGDPADEPAQDQPARVRTPQQLPVGRQGHATSSGRRDQGERRVSGRPSAWRWASASTASRVMGL